MHLPAIIQDLAIILIVAGGMTLLFRAIRQPVVLGYIVAGFLVGPYFKWIPTVVDLESIKVWAEIGVIFLLFALGLEFSFKKLARVGASASITALVEVVGMLGIGLLVGHFFDWGHMDSIFLGGILAISSTTIIIRAFDELQMKTHGFARLVFGVLIIEDLFAILLMVILSTIAVSQTFSGLEMGVAGLKLIFFLMLWFILGIFLIPSFLKRFRKLMNQESLLILSLALCFLMVVLATKVGFSPALGAFIMGSILAETLEAEKIEHLINPIKDLFGAIFFVSVGMLINPQILTDYAFPIFVITIATIIGKVITTTTGSLLSGQSLRYSVQAGMSLAQIGEFSFIIAGLGLSLQVTSDFLYPIAISVSAITTFSTPYLIRSSGTMVNFLEHHLPPKWLQQIERFRSASATVSHTNDWQNFVKSSIIKMTTTAVLTTALFLVVSEFFHPWFERQVGNQQLTQSLSLLIGFTITAPFVWAMIGGGRPAKHAANSLWKQRSFSGPLVAFTMLRWFLTILLLATLASRIADTSIVLVVMSIVTIVILYLLPKHFGQIYLRLENLFVRNLNEKEISEQKKILPVLAPWDSHLAELKISSDSSLVGKKLSELTIRERFGVTIALIMRGRNVIAAPGRNDVLYPGDTLQVIGSDEQINQFRQVCEASNTDFSEEVAECVYRLKPVYIDSTSSYVNKTIRDSGLREKTQGLVVGIEKRGARTLNPDSSTLIEDGDILWVVGNQNLMGDLLI